MDTRQGNCGLPLSELSFGCGAIGGLYRAVSDREAWEVLDAAWEAGIRYFDTAPFYGHGRSEQRLGSFLATKNRDEFVVSTKVGKLLYPVPIEDVPDHNFVDPLPNAIRFDYSRQGIEDSYRSSLYRLGLERIDILYVHDLEPKSHGAPEYDAHMSDFLSDGINALHSLKETGKISAFGLGVNQVEPCLEVLRHIALDIILLAGRYTLLDRAAEFELLKLCEMHGTDLVVGGVFNSGILATGAKPGAFFDYEPASPQVLASVSALEERCANLGLDLPAAALQFPLSNPIVKSVLIGTAKVSSLQRNVESLKTRIPDFALKQITPLARIQAAD